MAPKKAAAKDKKGDKPAKAAPASDPAASAAPKVPDASPDFEAGVMFNKYDRSKTGVVTAEDFKAMWREAKETLKMTAGAMAGGAPLAGASVGGGAIVGAPPNLAPPKSVSDSSVPSFEAGQIFAHFDRNNDGTLDKTEFEALVKQIPGLFSQSTNTADAKAVVPAPTLPVELISGRLLTHYDETAGIPLPKSSVDQHQAMGNLVTPLVDAYKKRYDKLRTQLTSKLFPKREHLLQIRRQLVGTADELSATKRAIEKETIKDVEGILERLRSVESLRQSSIQHQVLQLDDELGLIERMTRKVEMANEDAVYAGSTGIILTSAVPGTSSLEMVRAPRAQVMVELIQQFGDLSNNIEKLAQKPVTVDTEFTADDFPKEIAERLEVISRCDKYLHAMNVKDQILWTALQEKKKIEEQLVEERRLSQEYATEVAQWAELCQNLTQQLHHAKEDTKAVHLQNNHLIDILRRNNIFLSER